MVAQQVWVGAEKATRLQRLPFSNRATSSTLELPLLHNYKWFLSSRLIYRKVYRVLSIFTRTLAIVLTDHICKGDKMRPWGILSAPLFSPTRKPPKFFLGVGLCFFYILYTLSVSALHSARGMYLWPPLHNTSQKNYPLVLSSLNICWTKWNHLRNLGNKL